MKRVEKKNIATIKIEVPEQKNSSTKLVPENNIFSLDEMLDTFMCMHPSEFSGSMVEIEKKNGCILLFPVPKKVVFSFMNLETEENCIVDYVWNDVVRKEDL